MKCTIDNCTDAAITKLDDARYCPGHAIEQLSKTQAHLAEGLWAAQNKLAEQVNAALSKPRRPMTARDGAFVFVSGIVAAFLLGAMTGLLVVGYRWALMLSPAVLP